MPLIGYENLSGDLVTAFERAGHGRRLIIADRSLDIDESDYEAHRVHEVGGKTADYLGYALKLVRREGPLTLMGIDPTDNRYFAKFALNRFIRVAVELGVPEGEIEIRPRKDEWNNDSMGFYTIVDNPDERRLIVRVMDETLPYGCATYPVGNSQFGPGPQEA